MSTDLEAAFAELNRAVELEDRNAAREAADTYRLACERLDKVALNLPESSPQRELISNKRDHYRHRAKELSTKLLPVAVPIDDGKQSKSLHLIESNSVVVDDGSSVLGKGATPTTETPPAPPPTESPLPSAPPCHLVLTPDEVAELSVRSAPVAIPVEIAPATPLADTSKPDPPLPSKHASTLSSADKSLNYALMLDELGKHGPELRELYMKAAELYLEVYRESEGETKLLTKKKLERVIGRVEQLKQEEIGQEAVHEPATPQVAPAKKKAAWWNLGVW